MGHHCQHTHCDPRQDGRRLLWALAVTFVFMLVEIAGGILSRSLALLADAAHMSTDALALALAASAMWISSRPADANLHFGYRRVQVLCGFVNGILLLAVIAWIVFEALNRIANPEPVVWSTMLVIAVLGLLANGAAFLILTFGNQDNLNIRGAMLHVAGDLLGSVAAILAALIIMGTGWWIADPVLSLLVAGLIGRSAWRLVSETGHILLEGAPEYIDKKQLIADLKAAVPEIANIHNVQIWQLTPEFPRLTMHVEVNRPDAASGTLARVKHFLEEHYGALQSTIQIEMKDHCPDLLVAEKLGNDTRQTQPSERATAATNEEDPASTTLPQPSTTILH